MPDFLPRADLDLLQFAKQFEQQISADPQSFGQTPEMAAQLSLVVDAFADALAVQQMPATRTPVATTLKNDARSAMKVVIRQMNSRIRGHIQDDAARVSLGCKPVNAGRRAIPGPTEAPLLEVIAHTHGRLTVRLRSMMATQKGRPKGTRGATIFMAITDASSPSNGVWTFSLNTTKSIVEVPYPATLPPGARVWTKAYWYGTRGQPGPDSNVIGVVVGGEMRGLAHAAIGGLRPVMQKL